MPKFEDFIRIPKGYHFTFSNRIYSVLEEKFKIKLDKFLEGHSIIQKSENYPFLPKDKLTDFPFIEFKPYRNELFSRKQDIRLLKAFETTHFSENKTVLEFGGWNGWLTNRLSSYKMEVVSIDIFPDEENGLGSKKFYPDNNWLSIQADITDTSIHINKFDFIIFNHCLNFLPDSINLVKNYIPLLNENGLLIILGADISGAPVKKKKQIAEFREHYQNQYAFKINFYDCAGFLDKNAYTQLVAAGFTFTSYRFSFLGYLKKKLSSEKSGIFIYRNTGKI